MQANSQAIRRGRLAKGLTQAELADKVGLSRQAIWLIESDRNGVRPPTLRKIADALDVDVADLAVLPELETQAS